MQPANEPKVVKTGGNKVRSTRGIIIVLILLAVIGYFFFRAENKKEEMIAEANNASKLKLPLVRVVIPFPAPDSSVLSLPGDLVALRETNIYPRVNGYIRKWMVDIGDEVRQGALLAEIETPELDQQVVQTRSNMELAQSSLDRVNSVTLDGAVSKQQIDERTTALRAGKAMLEQLLAQTSFKKVLAPFNGVISSRNIEDGSLVNAGAAGRELFRINQVDRLRIFINVPQTFVPYIKKGSEAIVTIEEFPGKQFIGNITRTANALDPATRTLLTQVEVSNKERLLMPGMYAQVKLVFKRKTPAILLPASALTMRTEGTAVVEVTPADTLAIRLIRIAKDNGPTLEIAQGLKGGERLVINPNQFLKSGMKVEVVKNQPKQ